MKNNKKNIIEKVFWWTGITNKNDKEFLKSFMSTELFFYLQILFLISLVWLLLTSVVYNVPPEDRVWQLQFMEVTYLPIFFMIVLFAFFYKAIIKYQNNRIQELIPEYDPKLDPVDENLLEDAIKDASKLEFVRDDEFAEVVRALFLQNMEKQFRRKKAQRKKIDDIKSYIDMKIKDIMKMQFDDE